MDIKRAIKAVAITFVLVAAFTGLVLLALFYPFVWGGIMIGFLAGVVTWVVYTILD